MELLKRIPVKYKGELHDVRLVNFSVGMQEVQDKVPAEIKIRDFGGRALISMVDVTLKNMHPTFFPSFCHFSYRHVAFRLLVEDSMLNSGINKGIFFLRSFTDKSIVVSAGNLLTDYKLELASIDDKSKEVVIRQGNQHVRYCIDRSIDCQDGQEDLKKTVGILDRAYSVLGKRLRVTQIQREQWPIQPVNCAAFENTFFKTAKFEGAFRVFETIYYRWLPPKTLLN
jgi:uncharacterized protein YqjF (DUF2071 family)